LYTQLLRDKLSGMLADTDSLEQSMERLGDLGDAFYSDTFLEPRPLLR
ncbi:MAG TPA: ATPase, partial [Alcanivorax sp.]|nr:ATPase [Alcanivorax sp.]